jgi:hypothetical protein
MNLVEMFPVDERNIMDLSYANHIVYECMWFGFVLWLSTQNSTAGVFTTFSGQRMEIVPTIARYMNDKIHFINDL